jgi:hypothetical protein
MDTWALSKAASEDVTPLRRGWFGQALPDYLPGQSYYEAYARYKKIPNVTVSDYAFEREDAKSCRFKVWAFLVVFATRYNFPRVDFMFDPGYWRTHWKFTGWMTLVWILNTVFTLAGFRSGVSGAVVMMSLAWICAYGVSWMGVLAHRRAFVSFFERSLDTQQSSCTGGFIRFCFGAKVSAKAAAFQAFEFILWHGWMMLGFAITAILNVDYNAVECGKFFLFWDEDVALLENATNCSSASRIPSQVEKIYDSPLTLVLMLFLLVSGAAIKIYSAYLSGINNYYYADMVMNTPNVGFVDAGLYHWFSSPTYHIGYCDGYGGVLLAGFSRKGSPTLLLIFMIITHMTISICNSCIEQKSVREMYGAGSSSDDLVSDTEHARNLLAGDDSQPVSI